MATTKQIVPKKKSTSAPASPPKLEQPHRRSRTVPDVHHGDISKKITEQPTPRYLKPTISSCHDTNCHYPKHQQAPKPSAADPAAAGKRLASRKPTVEKVPSPTSACQKASAPAASSKERAARATGSFSTGKTAAPSTRTSLDTAASKTPVGAKTLPIRKTKSLPKLIQKSKEPAVGAASAVNEVKTVELEAVQSIVPGSELQTADAHPSEPSEIKDGKSKHEPEKEEELMNGDKSDSGERLKFNERQERKVAVAEAVAKVEAKSLVFKKQNESGAGRQESTPAYNEVIEEAASKLASRRSKVRALASAFETVISLQKPESNANQQQEEAEWAAKSGTGGVSGKDEHQEQQELRNGEMASNLKRAEAGQQSQLGTEMSNDGQGDAEMREDDVMVNVEDKSTEETTTESHNKEEHEQV